MTRFCAVLLIAICSAPSVLTPVARACDQVCGADTVPSEPNAEESRERLLKTPIVFVGRVVEVGPAKNEQGEVVPGFVDARLRVLREWRGQKKREYSLRTLSGSACGYPFRVGHVEVWFIEHDRQEVGGGCPESTPETVRSLVRALDRLTGRTPLKFPDELSGEPQGTRPNKEGGLK